MALAHHNASATLPACWSMAIVESGHDPTISRYRGPTIARTWVRIGLIRFDHQFSHVRALGIRIGRGPNRTGPTICQAIPLMDTPGPAELIRPNTAEKVRSWRRHGAAMARDDWTKP